MTKYIAYMVAPPKTRSNQIYFTTMQLGAQDKNIQTFLTENPGTIVDSFVEESSGNRHRKRWPQLIGAIKACHQHGAQLIIAQIRNLTNNEAFTDLLLDAACPKNKGARPILFYCLDQPFINRDNLAAIVKYSHVQRQYHGEIVKQAMAHSKTTCGNPKGGETLAKANRSNHDNAILFSLMMMPIIHDYLHKGYSQRKMVETLNQEAFPAFKGGQWRLSQLQKLLIRIKVNESALNLEETLLEYKNKKYSSIEIANHLNDTDAPSPYDEPWCGTIVDEVIHRLEQIQDIMVFNELILQLSPLLKEHKIEELSDSVLIDALDTLGIKRPQRWTN